MKNAQKIDLGLTGYDELFMNEAERKENKLPRIYDIPISEIDDFPDHPFKVKIDEDMDQLVQSIKERGIITPVTLRPKEDGRYEIVSGHRRKKACELAGFETVKAEVREMTRDEAIILMVESNLQRSTILPSEKAFSYKMRLEAMKRQGERSDLTSVPLAQKSATSREILGKEVGESQDQVRRYIRLTELIPELLDMVDESRIALRPAVELSYLKKEEQSALLEEISYADATPSLAQAIKMKKFSQEGKLSNDVIESIMSEEKPNQKEKINIKYEDARKYIPASVPYDKTGEYIMKALEYVLEYVGNDMKTEKRMYVTGINCNEFEAATQFKYTKEHWRKTGGIVAFHGYQSFLPGEVDADTAHEIGKKLAQELWGDRFEVVVATHLNRDHYHNHFVLNSVSYKDGKRYYDQRQTYARMREVSDRLCREYRLSVIQTSIVGTGLRLSNTMIIILSS